ncbi:MAG: mycofactocin precursor MftA [Thermoleophilia bacterium]
MDDPVTLEPTQVSVDEGAAAHHEPSFADLVLGEWDFEEISIDGICGVY